MVTVDVDSVKVALSEPVTIASGQSFVESCVKMQTLDEAPLPLLFIHRPISDTVRVPEPGAVNFCAATYPELPMGHPAVSEPALDAGLAVTNPLAIYDL